jgi:hypothetical protein
MSMPHTCRCGICQQTMEPIILPAASAPEPETALEVQSAVAWLRTIELACDARDDRQSVTYIGQIRALLHRLSRASPPPGDGRREIDHLRHALLLIRSGPPPHMGNGEVASWAAHISSAALLPTLAKQAESPPEDSQELRDARFAIGALIAAAGGRVVIMPSVLVNLDQRSEIETFDDPVSGARIFSLKSPTATKSGDAP